MKKHRISKHRIRGLIIGCAALFGFSMVAIPAAQAATIYYAYGTMTSENAVVSSGLIYNLRGGTAQVGYTPPDSGSWIVYIESYRPAPGYQTYYFGVGAGAVTGYHTAVSSAYSKCWWDYPYGTGNIGQMDTYCAGIN